VSFPPTVDELRVLRQWEMIVVNPFRPGVTEALLHNGPTYVVGRVDIGSLISSKSPLDEIGKLELIAEAVIRTMRPVDRVSPYNGALIANWEGSLPPEICNELAAFLSALNLNVYTEVVGPQFNAPPSDHLSGMVFCNGSVLPNGTRRDYFQLLPMKKALDAATSQACLREFTILMCDVIDDDAELLNAVVKRSFTWCGYYGAIPWIGRKCVLEDASINLVVESPDGAFEFLKRDKVVEIQNRWKENCRV
jgi:hypothetical protein